MCRTERLLRAAGVALLLLSAAGCDREQRTVVLDPATGRPRVAAQPAPTTPQQPAPPAPTAQQDQPSVAAPTAPTGDAATLLASRRPMIPVEGIAASALRDNYEQGRGSRKHEAIDIMAPRGARVFAADDGKLVKLFRSVPGGITAYQFDRQGQLAYYYAHLDRYADGLAEGMELKRGDLIGYVGTSGNAAPDAPHLHFAVFRLGPERQWWKGVPVNPYPALRAQ